MAERMLRTVRGANVALTGKCGPSRPQLVRAIRRAGGTVDARGSVTRETTVFVRGESESFKFGDYGIKEDRVAALMRSGAKIAVVSSENFQRILRTRRAVRCEDYLAGKSIDALREEGIARRATETAGKSGKSLVSIARRLVRDRKIATFARAEQAVLRAYLLHGRERAPCSLCGREYPAGLLVAGHIKPRARCSPRERADLESVAMLVCLLGCDALYERGYLSVAEDGRVLVSGRLRHLKIVREVVSRYRGRSCEARTRKNAGYFEWHRRNRYEK